MQEGRLTGLFLQVHGDGGGRFDGGGGGKLFFVLSTSSPAGFFGSFMSIAEGERRDTGFPTASDVIGIVLNQKQNK